MRLITDMEIIKRAELNPEKYPKITLEDLNRLEGLTPIEGDQILWYKHKDGSGKEHKRLGVRIQKVLGFLDVFMIVDCWTAHSCAQEGV